MLHHIRRWHVKNTKFNKAELFKKCSPHLRAAIFVLKDGDGMTRQPKETDSQRQLQKVDKAKQVLDYPLDYMAAATLWD